MAKTINKSAKVETVNGSTLPEPIQFSYSYEELQKGDDIPADEQPDADDLRTWVNAKRNSSARASAQNTALADAGIAKPTLEDPAFRLKQMVKILTANGMDAVTAETSARAALGM